MVEDSYDINNGKLCVSWVKFYFLFLLSDLSFNYYDKSYYNILDQQEIQNY